MKRQTRPSSTAATIFIVGYSHLLQACGSSSDGKTAVTTIDSSVQAADAGQETDSGLVELFDSSFERIDASLADATIDVSNCTPGLYVGKYSCGDGPIQDGPLSFRLTVSETTVDGGTCSEFCEDLVVDKGTGKLSGSWTIAGFEGVIEGGLDCKTGVFKAHIKDGVWGLPPLDADSGVIALSTFQATLEGKYGSDKPESIKGTWNIKPDIAQGDGCTGNITLVRDTSSD